MSVCLVAVRLCTAGGMWTEMCVWLRWGCVLLAECELKCVSGCGEVMYCFGKWTETCVWLRWVYVLLAECELNSVSGCVEVMYCWRIVNWTVCLFAVRLCTVGGMWTELCVWLRWGYVLLADCELNCVLCCGVVMYSWRNVNKHRSDTAHLNWRGN